MVFDGMPSEEPHNIYRCRPAEAPRKRQSNLPKSALRMLLAFYQIPQLVVRKA
jgi:hypothetical protein